jgi:succinoglycan biosynthesis protein ExoA
MSTMASGFDVSVIMPVRNERSRIEQMIAGIEAQTRLPDEVLVVDGMSTDGTREWLAGARRRYPWLHLIDNPARVIPTALNIGLRHAQGEFVARMDAHADYAPDYLEKLTGFLAAHPRVSGAGGAMGTGGRTAWGDAIAATLRRPFGLGGAPHRVGGGLGPVAHVFSGCYRREALLAIGGFDEHLLANEDFELDIRLQAAGGVLYLVPAATSTWYVRSTPKALVAQMFRYGYFKAATVYLHPSALKARQMAPPVLICSLIALLLRRPRVGVGATAVYVMVGGSLGSRAAISDGASPWRGAVVPAMVHLSWGSGLLVGLVRQGLIKVRGECVQSV